MTFKVYALLFQGNLPHLGRSFRLFY